ncbi:MAG: 2-C-methyl-D-erythritol 4-phosphate cytidylyltransferase [Acidaminobacteraceae bacterium]
MNDKISLIIAAAGSGSRMKADKNKILLDLEGKLVLERTLDRFLEINEIVQLIVVAKKEDIQEIKNIVDMYSFLDIRVVSGGNTRQESIWCGLNEVIGDSSYIIVHDAARPFIKEEYIRGAISMAKRYGASGVGVRVKDTLKKVDAYDMILETVDRSIIWQIQTPQIFRLDIIKEAYKYAIETNYVGTDDCSLVEHLGKKVAIFEGDYDNIKLTTKEDMEYAKFMLR